MLFVGIDQAYRHTGICVIEINDEDVNDYVVHFYTVNTQKPLVNPINEVFLVAPEIVKQFLDFLENGLRLNVVKHLNNPIYLALEYPLEMVYRANGFSNYQGASSVVTHEEYGLYQQIIYHLLTHSLLKFKMLSFHPNVCRGFLGKGKVSSINYRQELFFYYKDKISLKCGRQRELNDHNIEAWLYADLMLFMNNPIHPAVNPNNYQRFFSILKQHNKNLENKWLINYRYDLKYICSELLLVKGISKQLAHNIV